jgi:hypothetical protein
MTPARLKAAAFILREAVACGYGLGTDGEVLQVISPRGLPRETSRSFSRAFDRYFDEIIMLIQQGDNACPPMM